MKIIRWFKTIRELDAAHDAQNSALSRKQARIYEYRKLIKRLCGLLRFKRMEFDAMRAENAALRVEVERLEDIAARLREDRPGGQGIYP